MSIDLSQFHQVFYEESYEGLDAMEQGLLAMDMDEPDDEVINTIFRAAHSIKGGSGTFGFMQVASFTHVVETLLDEVRSGTRKINQDTLDLLLTSVDCMRTMLEELQAGGEPDMSNPNDLKAKFEAVLSGNDASAADNSADTGGDAGTPPAEDESATDGTGKGWLIHFVPEIQMLQTGNEPARMLRQLSELCEGNLVSTAHIESLPDIHNINPEHCFISWHIEVHHDVPRSDVDEVFEWVIDDAEIEITPLSAATDAVTDVDNTAAEMPTLESAETPAAAAETPATAAETPAAAESTAKKTAPKKAAPESSSIRVSIDKVDSLINMVGELVITQSMLGELGENFDMSHVQRLQEGLAQLEHNTRELQESVMKIRMMPISFIFSRFPRLVRDVSRALDKKIELKMTGDSTELDKTVMEKLGDPMVHLVRNSIDHGIEIPSERLASGKDETGVVELKAYHQSGNVVIEIQDDGAGLNKDRILQKAQEKGLVPAGAELSDEKIFDLIFQPGFSTADVVSDLSGRGVGMDVVRRNIAALNGSIDVSSTVGEGSRFVIRLPLTLAILDGQLVRVGEQTYIFPLVSIVESIQMDNRPLNNVGGHSDVLQLRDEYVPIVALKDIFVGGKIMDAAENSIIVVVEHDGEKVGVVVDELLGQQQVVIKSLEDNYQKVEGISGATILGDGTVALIIDITGMAKMVGGSPVQSLPKDKDHKAA